MDKVKRPQDQTHEEWLADYSGTPARYEIANQTSDNSGTDKKWHRLRFIDHRTTTLGSVVLEFESLEGEFRAMRFFNANLTSLSGKTYPSGHRGQFIPPERGKFRRFWMQAVGKSPNRWCRVHRAMRSQLGSLVFVGIFTQAKDRKGESYFKLTEVKAE